jgi:uncharacterized membrane protein YfcA
MVFPSKQATGLVLPLLILAISWRYSSIAGTLARRLELLVALPIRGRRGACAVRANAAGPLMAMYFVAMRLPKLEYVGTAAVFFMLLNFFKVPFMVNLGLITLHSLEFNLMLAPGVVLGVVAGRWLLTRINQSVFEQTVLVLCATAGILLIL